MLVTFSAHDTDSPRQIDPGVFQWHFCAHNFQPRWGQGGPRRHFWGVVVKWITGLEMHPNVTSKNHTSPLPSVCLQSKEQNLILRISCSSIQAIHATGWTCSIIWILEVCEESRMEVIRLIFWQMKFGRHHKLLENKGAMQIHWKHEIDPDKI